MTRIVLNFSHPLSERARQAIEERHGEFREIAIGCQIDFDGEIAPQLEALEAAGDAALRESGGSLWAIVPPALSYASAWIGGRYAYAQSDAVPPTPPRMIVLRREGTPPEFVLAAIV